MEARPEDGMMVEVAPGILWGRTPMESFLSHVNVYAIDDGDGWAIFDAGLNDGMGRGAWERYLAGPLAGRPITRIMVSHHHPDHIGLAGWLCERFDVPLHMTPLEYLHCHAMLYLNEPIVMSSQRGFYQGHGFGSELAEYAETRHIRYQDMTTGLPGCFSPLESGTKIELGGSYYEIYDGPGHSPCQAMLYNHENMVLLGADHILGSISPNVSVSPMQPEANPLRQFIDSLHKLQKIIPEHVLVLPGHGAPFVRLPKRVDELVEGHAKRCELIQTRCAEAPLQVADLVRILFPRPLDPQQMVFAVGEVLAHVNFLIDERKLRFQDGRDDRYLETTA